MGFPNKGRPFPFGNVVSIKGGVRKVSIEGHEVSVVGLEIFPHDTFVLWDFCAKAPGRAVLRTVEGVKVQVVITPTILDRKLVM